MYWCEAMRMASASAWRRPIGSCRGRAGRWRPGDAVRLGLDANSLSKLAGLAAPMLEFYSSKTGEPIMSCEATLRQSGGSIILSIPKSIAKSMAVEAGSVVELQLEGRSLSITPARRTLADRLAQSPKSPATWHRDAASLNDYPVGRELL
jgi:antitoxin ChpS